MTYTPRASRPIRWVACVLIALQIVTQAEMVTLFANAAPAALQEVRKALPRKRLTPNRKVPSFAPRQTRLPEYPTDAEIFQVPIFEERLTPVGRPTTREENKAFAAALRTYVDSRRHETVTPVLDFLQRYPESPWRASVLANVGTTLFQHGYFSRALRTWDAAWQLTRHETSAPGYDLANYALAKWLEGMTVLGNSDALKTRLKEIEGRRVGGSPGIKVLMAREGLEILEKRHHEAIPSGPAALNALVRERDRKLGVSTFVASYQKPKAIAEVHATKEGMSLLTLQELGLRVGERLRMVYRPSGSSVVVTPAIVHFHVDHFATIIRAEGERYLLRDGTLGDRWVSRQMVDEESSGYMLVREGAPLPEGWRAVEAHEGRLVMGRCLPPVTLETDDPGPQLGGEDGDCAKGLAIYGYHPVTLAVKLSDTPVGYKPPRGPAINITLNYNEYDPSLAVNPWHGNFGPQWTSTWTSYVAENAYCSSFGECYPYTNKVHVRGGGIEHYSDSAPQQNIRTQALLVRTSTSPLVYERRLPDGTIERFAQSDGGQWGKRKILLTEVIDPNGNTVTLTYDTQLRLVAITDAIGQVTGFSYDHPTEPTRITRITDPFGRFATFTYLPTGELASVTDTIGMVSSFEYNQYGTMMGLTTPYGVTRFRRPQATLLIRVLEITDAMGGTEHIEFHNYPLSGLGATAPTAEVPTGFSGANQGLNEFSTLRWDKRMWALHPGDLTTATHTRWMLTPPPVGGSHDLPRVITAPHSIKRPLENRVWFQYPGQTAWNMTPHSVRPTRTARTLDDGTTQIREVTYNDMDRPLSMSDPSGRETTFVYDTNLIDLLEVRQTTGSLNDVMATLGNYTTGHKPRVVTDAAGQTTTLTYNGAGQVATVTNAASETTTFTYDINGYLQRIAGPASGATFNFTYDDYGRVETVTNVDGDVTTTEYDALDRVTKVTYPDATYEQVIWNRLEVATLRDRQGRVTRMSYDRFGRPTSVLDPDGRTVRQEWCGCGTLEALIDGKGNRIEWQRDAMGRVTREVRGGGPGDTQFVYENTTSRLKQVIDAKGQVTNFTYDINDDVSAVAYTNATIATPGVSYTYDPNYRRIATMVDQTGTTTFTYRAVGTLGAGQVASVDGPLTNDTLTYTYDVLGRVASRSVNATGSAWTYDDLGRVSTETNALGAFTYDYDGLSDRLASVAFPNGQTSSYAWFDETADRRLQTMHHRKPGNVTLSKIDFTYDAAGHVRTQDIQHDAAAPTRWTYEYDAAGQLTFARHATTGGTPTELVRYGYGYDRTGNRTTEQVDDAVLSTTHDGMNRMLAQTPGGAIRVAGSINEPGLVNVDGREATVAADHSFFATFPLGTGPNTFTVRAKDASGNTATQAYEFTVAGGNRSFSHDANGNLTSDGVRTFEWDAADRLVAVEEGTQRVEYTYNGVGQRTQVVKKTSGVTDWTRRLVWAELDLLEERNSAGTAVVKRYLAQGVQEGTDAYFYTRDHLGSLVNLTDTSMTLRARYAYDPYGRGTRTTGDREADIGFTGHMLDRETDLALTYFRAYDPSLGRWLSKDPIGEAGGINLYAYVGNDPIMGVDPLGLYDLLDLGIDVASFAAGLGNAVSFGGSSWLSEQVMNDADAELLRLTKSCSDSFAAGEWTSLALGGGRLAYAGIAKGASAYYGAKGATMANAAAAVAFRNGLKQAFRLGLGKNFRVYPFSKMVDKYGTPEKIIAAAGRTNKGFNAAGAEMAGGAAAALAQKCECKK
jgi:RHS repeat-associated protein